MAVRILHGPATSGKKNVVTILISISLSISAVSRAGQHNSNAFESESESESGSEGESFPLGFAEKSSCLLRGLHSGSWHGAVDRSRVRWGSRSPIPRPWALRCAVPAVNCPNVRKDAAVGRFAAVQQPSTAQTCGRTPRALRVVQAAANRPLASGFLSGWGFHHSRACQLTAQRDRSGRDRTFHPLQAGGLSVHLRNLHRLGDSPVFFTDERGRKRGVRGKLPGRLSEDPAGKPVKRNGRVRRGPEASGRPPDPDPGLDPVATAVYGRRAGVLAGEVTGPIGTPSIVGAVPASEG